MFQFFDDVLLVNFIAITKEDRYRIAQVALETNLPPALFYGLECVTTKLGSTVRAKVLVKTAAPPTPKTPVIIFPEVNNNIDPLLDETITHEKNKHTINFKSPQ